MASPNRSVQRPRRQMPEILENLVFDNWGESAFVGIGAATGSWIKDMVQYYATQTSQANPFSGQQLLQDGLIALGVFVAAKLVASVGTYIADNTYRF